mmetsp:Transcript_64927/g.180432  ORF Transcript_64927/g.180432 Transcript_64927/m.180432 type:complete len:207 (-) Transcript_64927:616-1236(-)
MPLRTYFRAESDRVTLGLDSRSPAGRCLLLLRGEGRRSGGRGYICNSSATTNHHQTRPGSADQRINRSTDQPIIPLRYVNSTCSMACSISAATQSEMPLYPFELRCTPSLHFTFLFPTTFGGDMCTHFGKRSPKSYGPTASGFLALVRSMICLLTQSYTCANSLSRRNPLPLMMSHSSTRRLGSVSSSTRIVSLIFLTVWHSSSSL